MTTNLELRDEPPYNVKLKVENERLRAALGIAASALLMAANRFDDLGQDQFEAEAFAAQEAVCAALDVQQTQNGEPK